MLLTAVWVVKRKHRAMATKAVCLCMQVPVQVASAVLMLLSAGWAEARLNAADIWAVTALFFFLVLLAATQDIAVDGWALTLLSRHNIGCDITSATAPVVELFASPLADACLESLPCICASFLPLQTSV